jgi:hypothetical protein
MTIEECLRAIVREEMREEMRPVEIKLSLMASLIQQLCKEIDENRCRASTTSMLVSVGIPANST